MLILLAVFWVAGSLLLAAESPQTPKPAQPAATQTTDQGTTTAKSGDAKAPDTKAGDARTSDTKATDAKGGTQDQAAKDPKEQRSIAEQAEAALKAAAEADGSAAKPKAEDKSAVDESQPPPGAGKGPSPQRFVPSEQVRADFDVSFPIDI
jgi:hypothetical protein